MEDLAGLGATAVVAQFVIFGFQSANFLYRAYQNPDNVRNERRELEALARQRWAGAAAMSTAPGINIEPSLRNIVPRAMQISSELKKEFDDLERRLARDGRRARMELVIKSVLIRAEMERLLRRLTQLRVELSQFLIEITSQKIDMISHREGKLNSFDRANDAEKRQRLNWLLRDLVQAHNDMRNAPESKIQSLFEAMVQHVMAATEHDKIRTEVESIPRSLLFDIISDRASAVQSAHEATCEWAFLETTTTLPNWLRSGTGIYWIEGKAGSGKSTFIKFLQRDSRAASMLEEWAGGGGGGGGERPLILLSHFFWAAGTEIQKNLLGLLSNLLFQILIKNPQLAQDICPLRVSQDVDSDKQPWTVEELETCLNLVAAMHTLPSKLCIFIDGLDECRDEEADRLVAFIGSISKSDNIKVVVSSRPLLPFQNAYGESSQKLSIHDFTGQDIQLYAQETLGESKKYHDLQQKSPEQAIALASEISGAADGVFLRAYLAVRELLSSLAWANDITDLRMQVQGMPRELNHFFERMLLSVEDSHGDEVHSLLRILANTRIPLNTLLTHSHHLSRECGYLHSDNLFKFPPHSEDESKKKREEWDQVTRRWKAASEDYEAQTEGRRVAAICKGLVHVSKPGDAMTYPCILGVGFLHRTVAEFIGSAMENKAQRDGIDSRMQAILPIVAMAETYLGLLARSSCLGTETHSEYQRWILCLALEAKKHSPSAYLSIVRSLCAVENAEKTATAEYMGTVLAADVAIEGPCTRAAGTTTSLDAPDNFWALHCRGCSAQGIHPRLMTFCFNPPQVPRLAADGTVTLTTHPQVNVRVVQALVMGYEKHSPGEIWGLLLRGVEHLRSKDRAPAANIYDVCRIFVRHRGLYDNRYEDIMKMMREFPEMVEVKMTNELLRKSLTSGRNPYNRRI